MTVAFRNPDAHADADAIDTEALAALAEVAARYAVAITPAMDALIDRADPQDPIARQFLPDVRELLTAPGERADPIGDDACSPIKGIVHRYPDRVLLKPLHACALYCRFCFRRAVVGPGGEGMLTAAELDAAFGYIAATPSVWEVVITGGDPLVLSARRLGDLARRLAAIPHVRIVRFHTRVPAVEPERVTPEVIDSLRASGKTVWLALHANHAREFTPAADAAVARIVDSGVPMISQSVLLKGVNDTPEALTALMRAFVERRIKPYYLHHGDHAPGTAHLRTTLEEGRALMSRLRGDLSGLAQPTYVLDIPDGHGKVPVGPAYVEAGAVRDPWGRVHAYPPRDD